MPGANQKLHFVVEFCISLYGEGHRTESIHSQIKPHVVTPFRLTYLAGRGVGGGSHPIFKFNHCLADILFIQLTYRPTLGLPKYKLKVVNICEMHATRGIEVVVFD